MLKILSIVKSGHPALSKKSIVVTQPILKSKDFIKLEQRLKKIVMDEEALGVAAPQVGVNWRMFIMREKDNTLSTVVNPSIVGNSAEKSVNWEGCLSFDNIRAKVERFSSIDVKYMDRKGDSVERKLEEDQAIVFQHEMDHLDGITMVDRAGLPENVIQVADDDSGSDGDGD